jgi:NAD+ diphosphatase
MMTFHSDSLADGSERTVIAVRRQRPLVTTAEPFGLRYLAASAIAAPQRLIPLEDGAPGSFSLLEIDGATSDEDALVELGLDASEARFADVMTQLGRFAGAERERLLRAVALAQWSHENRFCCSCGLSLRWDAGARTKSCANPAKAHRHFPRTDPATIMLVHDGTRALLGRQRGWPPGMYSTLAGFVEPGETAEDGVAREVFEETGVRVRDVRYVASESWPFPRSLMLGFTARADTHEIAIGEEMDDVRWFTPEEVRAMQAGVRERLPYFDTIARRLLAAWLDAAPVSS